MSIWCLDSAFKCVQSEIHQAPCTVSSLGCGLPPQQAECTSATLSLSLRVLFYRHCSFAYEQRHTVSVVHGRRECAPAGSHGPLAWTATPALAAACFAMGCARALANSRFPFLQPSQQCSVHDYVLKFRLRLQVKSGAPTHRCAEGRGAVKGACA